MATAHIEVKRVEFIIQESLTICNVFYTSDEPGTPWGGGWKTKTFPTKIPAIDILTDYVPNYIMWNDGRDGIEENEA